MLGLSIAPPDDRGACCGFRAPDGSACWGASNDTVGQLTYRPPLTPCPSPTVTRLTLRPRPEDRDRSVHRVAYCAEHWDLRDPPDVEHSWIEVERL